MNVVSNQPPLDDGSGNANPDVVFGTGAFCIRAERDGLSSSPREYTVTLVASDASGNFSKPYDVVISVPHDQGQANKCASVDASRIVSDDDPRFVMGLVGAFLWRRRSET